MPLTSAAGGRDAWVGHARSTAADAAGTGCGTAGGPGTIELDPNASYQSDVRLANWCAPDPSFPVTLELKIGAEEVAVTGSSFPEQGDMPPCNGDGGPLLEAGAWAVSG